MPTPAARGHASQARSGGQMKMKWLCLSRCVAFSATAVVVLQAGAMLYPAPSVAYDDEYTRAIRSEGSKLQAINRSPETPAEPAAPAAPAANGRTQAEFEAELRAQAAASRRFYDELDTSRKRLVYDYYLKEGGVTENVRRFIVKLRLGS